ncbi:hypothetical protein SCP_1600180 [Sparassis crispa]|uniref:Protein kinase domain-containing protein n=1 Tax=Sparassis crispa TaxID=139825 RepID=A0A401H4J7_9APHY|nr:hypothetical protein SCP_1600180 [Sparassis crispa]GBE89357.1 hypothetical protein SCP_1600180 [Sparassis crispa]
MSDTSRLTLNIAYDILCLTSGRPSIWSFDVPKGITWAKFLMMIGERAIDEPLHNLLLYKLRKPAEVAELKRSRPQTIEEVEDIAEEVPLLVEVLHDPAQFSPDKVHVLVVVARPEAAVDHYKGEPPPGLELHPVEKAHLAAVKAEQDKHPIYNGRPDNCRSSPIVLYESAFAKLKDVLYDLRQAQPDRDFVAATAKLFLSAATIYNSESERESAIFDHIERLLDVTFERHVKAAMNRFSSKKDAEADTLVRERLDDTTHGEKKGIYICIEVKNELGMGRNSGLQGALTLLKHISQDGYEGIRNVSCCPCFVISIAGPYICFSGAVLVDIFIVQPFTDYIYLGGDPIMNERITHVAKLFSAVADAAMLLREHYRSLSPSTVPKHGPLLPSPAYGVKHPEGALEFVARFDYEGRKIDNYRRSLFRATFDGKPVLVKFCETYNERAHRMLADIGLAPKLYFCAQICGHVNMIIMEFVDSRDTHHQFSGKELPPSVMRDVKRAVDELHRSGLIFGDLRRPNIMVVTNHLHVVEAARTEKDTAADAGLGAMLIDFDWAGDDDQAQYPALLNDSGEISWADGVAPAARMKKQHDLGMIEKLNRHRSSAIVSYTRSLLAAGFSD